MNLENQALVAETRPPNWLSRRVSELPVFQARIGIALLLIAHIWLLASFVTIEMLVSRDYGMFFVATILAQLGLLALGIGFGTGKTWMRIIATLLAIYLLTHALSFATSEPMFPSYWMAVLTVAVVAVPACLLRRWKEIVVADGPDFDSGGWLKPDGRIPN